MDGMKHHGATRRTIRERSVFLPLLIAFLTLAAIFAVPAFAVHDTGAFQLDGNAQTSEDSTPSALEDWDMVCPPDTPPGVAPGCLGGTIADVHTFKVDPSASSVDNILTGGGTKDDLDVPNWKWKSAKPSPPKNDIGNGFAAEYSIVTDGPYKDHSVLFFGGDRISNNGDANIAFWFFHNKVTAPGDSGTPEAPICSAGSGCSFVGTHKVGNYSLGGDTVGDILVVSAFTTGGTQPTIKIYEWVGPGNATKPCFTNSCSLQPIVLPADQGAACDGAQVTGDVACALVNTMQEPSPWAFREADGKVPDNTFNPGDLYEGGLDLTGLGLGDECFSSFLLNTRSSQSGDSVLHDFVIGEFGRCGATLTTTPSAGMTEQSGVAPGVPVTDTATVQGTGLANPPTPEGDVTFYLCDRTDVSSTATCSPDTGTQVGDPVTLADSSPPPGEAQATSAQVNTPGDPLVPGRYCFSAEWPGDSNYTSGPYTDGPYASGEENTECFLVRQLDTTTVTTPSDKDGVAIPNPLTTGVALGTNLFDKAVVTGSTLGGAPTGNVNFYVCDPSQVTLNNNNEEVCVKANGSALSGNPRPLSAVDSSSSSALSSPAVVANKAGVWCFAAEYVPTGTVYKGSGDASHGECVKVNPDKTTTKTTPKQTNNSTSPLVVAINSQVTDYAKVTGTTAGGTPTGEVNFWICDPTQVTGSAGAEVCVKANGTAVTGNPVTLAPVAGSSPPAADATSGAVTANKLGVWCFAAEFTPKGANAANYTGSDDATHGECFTVRTTSSATSAQNWLPNDSVTISSVGGVALDGTLDITLRQGSCTGTVVYTEPQKTLTNAASGTSFDTTNGQDANNTFKVSTASNQDYYWRAVFASSNTFVDGITKCEKTNMTIDNNP